MGIQVLIIKNGIQLHVRGPDSIGKVEAAAAASLSQCILFCVSSSIKATICVPEEEEEKG